MNPSLWLCAWCGGGAEDEDSLRDHQEWCLGDARLNTELLDEVAARDGELSQEALVAAARKRRPHMAKKQVRRSYGRER